MKRFLLIWVLATAGTVSAVSAETVAPLEEAKVALREVPQVAVQKLRTLLRQPDLQPDTHTAATLLLAEALIAAEQGEEALTVLDGIGSENPDATLLRAHALAALGRWNDALPLYQQLAASPTALPAARVGEGETLVALGRQSDAVAAFERAVKAGTSSPAVLLRLAGLYSELHQHSRAKQLLNSVKVVTPEERNWKRYVEARILMTQNQAFAAMEEFQGLLREPGHLPESLLFGATLGLTDARVIVSGSETADEILEIFIKSHPQSRYLEQAFRRLFQIYLQEEAPDTGVLDRWAQRLPAPRAALAMYYAARMAFHKGTYDKAQTLLDRFLKTFPGHGLTCDVYVLQADLHLVQWKLTEAVQELEEAMRRTTSTEQRGEIELRTAIAHYQQGEFLLAANLFRSAATRSPRLKTVATYNAALAWLNQNSDEHFFGELRTLSTDPQSTALRSELLLEQGLVEARRGEVSAPETLQLFLQQNPAHARAGEARVALAELAFQASEASASPNQQALSLHQASEYLQVANTESHTPEMAAQADYLAIFLADAQTPRIDAKVIELGQAFLRAHKESPLVTEVRMKLGQVYFRTEDYANAETQFATLVREAPTSPYAETALYLAGQSAMGLAMNPGAMDRALAFFDQLVKRDGPLKLYGRQEQAIAQSRVHHENEAIILYDLVLSAQPPADPELRFSALCGKADNLVVLGRTDPSKLDAAITVLDQLATASNVTATWRNQALYKKAKALEQLGRTAEALTAYYDVLNLSKSTEREHFWSSKAGFDAGRLLEQQEQWKAAIGIYDKLANLKGPRAGEAEARLKQIRLEHFVWD